MQRRFFKFFIFIQLIFFGINPSLVKANSMDSQNMQMYMTREIDINKDNTPVIGAEVQAFDQIIKTDNKGIAHFENLMDGNQTIIVTLPTEKYKQTVNISSAKTILNLSSSSLITPPLKSTLPQNKSSNTFPFFIFIIASILLIIATLLGIFMFILKRKNLDKYRPKYLIKHTKGKLMVVGIYSLVFIAIFIEVIYLTSGQSFLKIQRHLLIVFRYRQI